jgi:two-component system, OmpR family, sensor histidine kinase MtrB
VSVALPDEPVLVRVDATLVSLILDNLITNAILHGSTPVKVEVTARPPRVTVADSGAGVSRDVREKIFEPFFQVEGQLRGRGGAGLGLAVSRRLANLHRGTLVLDESTQGASFTLTLPDTGSQASSRPQPATSLNGS